MKNKPRRMRNNSRRMRNNPKQMRNNPKRIKKKTSKIKVISKIILVLFLILVFFEMGLIGSYTIVTSNAPDIEGLIDMQVKYVLEVFSVENLNKAVTKDLEIYQISNSEDVATTLKNLTNVDGINIRDINASSKEVLKNGNTGDVKIEVFGYSNVNSLSDQIILNKNPDIKIVASAKGKIVNKKIKIEISSIQIISTVTIKGT
jgi:hypothetical protein